MIKTKIIVLFLALFLVSGCLVYFFAEDKVKAQKEIPLSTSLPHKQKALAPIVRKATQAKIIFAGDLMALGAQIRGVKHGSKYNFMPVFQNVKNIISKADYAFANLESPIAGDKFGFKRNFPGQIPVLNAPVSFLDAVKSAGFDCVMTANNHCVDQKEVGLINTIKNIKAKGLKYTGTFLSKTDPNKTKIITVNNIKLGILSYTRRFNGKENYLTKAKQEYMINKFEPTKAKNDVKRLKKAGAEYVIVYIHWGNENTNSYDYSQERDGKALAVAGANLIIGTHPHSLQGIRNIYVKVGATTKKTVVVYSLGNFVSSMPRAINRDGALLEFTFKKSVKGVVTASLTNKIPIYTMPSYKGVPFCEVASKIVKTSETRASIARVMKILK
ncbi:MAG: CapA family protein [Bacillota bacterium]